MFSFEVCNQQDSLNSLRVAHRQTDALRVSIQKTLVPQADPRNLAACSAFTRVNREI
jgi:hypothetical protein